MRTYGQNSKYSLYLIKSMNTEEICSFMQEIAEDNGISTMFLREDRALEGRGKDGAICETGAGVSN